MSYYGIQASRVVAYTFEAAVHCVPCAEARFGTDGHGFIPESATDGEGNSIGAVFVSDNWRPNFEACDTCGEVICMTCGDRDDYYTLPTASGESLATCRNCGAAEEPETWA